MKMDLLCVEFLNFLPFDWDSFDCKEKDMLLSLLILLLEVWLGTLLFNKEFSFFFILFPWLVISMPLGGNSIRLVNILILFCNIYFYLIEIWLCSYSMIRSFFFICSSKDKLASSSSATFLSAVIRYLCFCF